MFDGNRVVHVDPAYAGKADREIDGAGFCVMPGMVNVHTHLQSESIGRGLIEELGNQALYQTGILDEKSVFVTSGLTEQAGGAAAQLKANKASTQNAIAELLKSGCTTVTDLAVAWDGWLDILADTGIRAVAAPMYRDARWYRADRPSPRLCLGPREGPARLRDGAGGGRCGAQPIRRGASAACWRRCRSIPAVPS